MEEITRTTENITSIFAMLRPKEEIKQIFDKNGVTRLFVRNILGKDSIVKTYYDTPTQFFASCGINIYTVTSITDKTKQVFVQLVKNTKRIYFLSNMPTMIVKTLTLKDDIRREVDFIESAVYDIFPNGLTIDIRKLIPSLRQTIVINKNRERYRVFNNSGLKVILSIDNVEYKNLMTRMSDKVKQFEMQLDSHSETAYKDFVHRMSLQVPSLVPMDSSDLVNALSRTNFKKRK